MSVDYRAGLVYGYKVSYKDYNEMNAKSDYEYEDDFICVNLYDYESDYILGEWVKVIFEGTAQPFDMWEIAEALPDNFGTLLDEKLEAMGRTDLAQQAPQVYMVFQLS